LPNSEVKSTPINIDRFTSPYRLGAVDRNGQHFSELNSVSRAPSAPRSGYTLDTLFSSEKFAAIAIDGLL
jgi:hypothetical protein